jgi:hypothetical protein
MGPDALGRIRNRTFHYPYPNSRYPTDEELIKALGDLANEEAHIVIDVSGAVKRHRFEAADRVALELSIGEQDLARATEQSKLAHDGAVGFVNFVARSLELYAKTREPDVDANET